VTKLIILLLLLFSVMAEASYAQTAEEVVEGKVSYVTSSSVYVRFENTSHIQAGDTLYFDKNGLPTPALIVKNKSSLSCVCQPLEGINLRVDDRIISRKVTQVAQETVEQQVDSSAVVPVVPPATSTDSTKKKPRKQLINGRVSVSSYTNWANAVDDIGQRMRYTFSFGGQHLGGSKISLEMYMSFVHSNRNWEEIQDNMFNGLKIYNFSLRYDITQKTRLWLGRKINYKLTSLGAIDGLQFEHAFGSLTVGAVVGSRPDYADYSINFNLFQYGLYLSQDYTGKQGRMENTLAFMNQTNTGNTDRRFVYFQHTNTLVKKVFFMLTTEFDLYSKVDEQSTNTFDFSNLYVLLRWRAVSNFSISASYIARQNIIYYETYKDFLERLLEEETLQGFRLMLNYRPVKRLAIGAKAGYRFRPDDPRPTNDVYGYATYSLIPGINASATASVTWLETSYMTGWVYSLGFSRDFARGKLFSGLNYRYVSYDFTTFDEPTVQHVFEANLNLRVYNKLTLGAYWEGAFENALTYNRVYLNLTQRF
jgi:hypothetical protein